MQIPDFKTFWDSLSQEQISHWVDDANKANLNFHSLPIDQDQRNENINTIGAISLLLSRNMLAAYHEWLSQQLLHQE